MKAEYGDKITIPEGCNVTIKNGCVVFQKEFKDGDVLCAENGTLVIFKEKDEDDSEYFLSHYSTESSCIGCWLISAFRHATEEEKQLLFDKMKEKGLLWNAEEKKVEKIRWRAEDGKEYYYVGNQGILMVDTEDGHITDKNRYEFSNYFHTEKQAKEAIIRIKEVLKNYHNEIGE
jgi:hypothetical protein